MIALLILTSRRDIMGEFATGPLVRTQAIVGVTMVLGLDFVLLADVFGIAVPGFG